MIISLREPEFSDEEKFITAMKLSMDFHYPWASAPTTPEHFQDYVMRYKQPNNKSFLVVNQLNNLIGVFNLSEIVRGSFQNAYLGYYAVKQYAATGRMSQGLKLLLYKTFTELALHRLEANIQPGNTNSILLVKQNGFRHEGYSPRYLHINGQWCDHERWAITREDWQTRNES